MLTFSPPPVAAEAVAAAKTYLRIESTAEDALIASLIAAAVRHVEGFTNLIVLHRSGVDRLAVSGAWQRLGVTPVHAITSVTGLPADGSPFELPVTGYALDIDGSGDGWVRVTEPGVAVRIDVTVDAGLASEWNEIPEPLRLAILRLTGHLFTHRDKADDPGPPAAVAALMRGILAGPFGAGVERAGQQLETSLTRALRTGKLGFEDLKRVALSVTAEIAAASIRAGIGAIGGGGQGGGLLAAAGTALTAFLGAPGRATGGPVSPGRAYMVGERGPEIFVPTGSGTIATTGRPAQRDVRISIAINAPAGSAPEMLARSSRQVGRAVRAALARED